MKSEDAAVSRLFANHSIGQLEDEFDAARGDRSRLMVLAEELNRRGTERAFRLRAVLERRVEELDSPVALPPQPRSGPPDAEFLKDAVQQLRDKLIDIGKRNPLIAFKHTDRGASYVRIVDETLDGLYAGLSGGGTMFFDPLPDQSIEPADQRTPDFKLALEQARLVDAEYAGELDRAEGEPAVFERAEQALVARVRERLGLPKLTTGKTSDLVALARAHGVDPSLELPAAARGSHHTDKKVRVLMLPDKLRTRLATIADRYGGHARETGIHTLQLVLGFLEWREADASDAIYHAPLLTLAVDLKPEARTGRLKFVLAGRDEPLSVNMALTEMLRRFHDIRLPETGEAECPEQWLARIAPLLAQVKGLAIRRWSTLAVLPFPNMAVWRDLDVSQWPQLLEHEQIGLLLGGRERADASGTSAGLGFPADHPIDEWSAPAIPPLVLDADVSQHSALVDVTRGRSLAIEGPPGTGKSQTIANMIAGALSQGRRVLFVAEKQAALKVVGQRLDALGLGPLLFQLHSERGTKAAVLDGLKRTLALKAQTRSSGAREVMDAREELVERRDILRRYQQLLDRPLGEYGRRAGDLVWREMRLRTKTAQVLPRAVWDRGVAGADKVGPRRVADVRRLLDGVETAANKIRFADATDSRWRAGRRLPPNPIEQQQALDRLDRVAEAADAMLAWRDQVLAQGGDLNERPDALLALTRRFSTQVDPGAAPPRILKAALLEPDLVKTLAGRIRRQASRLASLRTHFKDPLAVAPSAISEALKALKDAGLPPSSQAQLQEALETTGKTLSAVQAYRTAAQPVASALGLQADQLNPGQLAAIQAVTTALVALDEDILNLRTPALRADDAGATLTEAAAAAAGLVGRRERLGAVDWTSAEAEGFDSLSGSADVLDRTPTLLRPFSGRFKAAKAVANRVLATPPTSLPNEARRLRDLVAWRRNWEAFNEGCPAKTLFGTAWRACDSAFDGLISLRWTLREAELTLRGAGLDAACLLLAAPRIDLVLWSRRLVDAPGALNGSGELTISEIERRLEDALDRLGSAQTLVAALTPQPGAVLTANLADDVREARKAHAEIAADAEGSAGAWFRGADEIVEELEAAAAWIEGLRRAVTPASVLKHLAQSDDPAANSRRLARLHADGEQGMESLKSAWEAFSAPLDLRTDEFLGAGRLTSTPLSELSTAIQEAQADTDGLRLHADLGRLLAEADAFEARWVYEAVVAMKAEPTSLADAYELALIRTLLLQFLRTDRGGLDALGGAQLSGVQVKYRDLDRQLAGLEAKRILFERLADKVPWGVSSGPVGKWTELPLIDLVCGQVRPRVTVRALIERAGRAVQAIKPVWMMSPTALAQFSPPRCASFDLVIIDEASQMTPEMAVGALGRGAQVVVVGDPQQLPPTHQFQVATDGGATDDGGADGAAVSVESILDLAYQKLGARRRLKWHYRSRHERLIEFSNREFYQRDLVVFPSAAAPDIYLGVRAVFAGGLYKARINEEEAKAVVNEAVGLMLARPELSLGVVTMNAEQREWLFQMFEDLKATEPVVRDYVARWEREHGGTEAFFIKNLENVQGDERDVIIISTVYGPTEPGTRPAQRFGLLNRHDEGHRRLNVLVTRAKRANWIVTSLRPNDVVAGPATSRGVQAFQRYLAYAAGAPTVDASQPDGVSDSDFEEFVAERLRLHGYEVIHQVGVDRFRIDLGVRHAAYPLGFIAGVECDGATYHSHYTVRDRDRIRQSVLEGLGWRIWRVWSTDWFNDPDRETTRLLAWLGSIRDEAEARYPQSSERARDEVAGAAAAASCKTPVDEDERLQSSALPTEGVLVVEADVAALTKPTVRPEPSGRHHEVDGLIFYDDPTMAGFFSVWKENVMIGEIERLGISAGPAKVFGGSVRAPLPEYRATREWDQSTFITSDIYEAVRRLGREHRLL